MPVGPLSAPFHKADTPCALQNFRQHASDTKLRTGHPHLSSVLKTGPKDTRGRNTRGDRSRRGHVFTGHPALPPPQPRLPSEAARTCGRGMNAPGQQCALRRVLREREARARDNALPGRYLPATDGKLVLFLRRNHEAAPPFSAPFHKADTPCALQNFRQHASDRKLRTGHRPFPLY